MKDSESKTEGAGGDEKSRSGAVVASGVDRKKPPRRRLWVYMWRGFWLALVCVALLVIAGALWGYFYGHKTLVDYVESDSFRQMISRATGKSLKVTGEFGPITLDEWTAKTTGFTSVGLPDQVITKLDAGPTTAVFDPKGLAQKLWEFSKITIEYADLGIQQPNLSKKPPKKQAPPWYAAVLPKRFYPDVVEAKKVNLQWKFRGQPASINPIHLFVTPDGINWQFTGTGGQLSMMLAPPMWLKEISIHMSKPTFNVQSATFVSLNPGDPAYIALSAKMGLLPDDRSLKATADFHAIPIDPSLPDKLKPHLSGLASGHLIWENDPKHPEKSRASGDLTLTDVILKDLPAMERMAKLHQDEKLKQIQFQQASLSFTWINGVFETNDLELRSQGRLSLEGKVRLPKDLDLQAELKIKELNLEPWLEGVHGNVEGYINWKGNPTKPDESVAHGHLNLNGVRLDNVPMLAGLANKYGIGRLKKVKLRKAFLDFSLDHGVSRVKEFVLQNGMVNLEGNATYTKQNRQVEVNVKVNDLPLERWLPEKFRVHFGGHAWGTMHYQGNTKNVKGGKVSGKMNIKGAVLEKIKFLDIMAAFLRDEGFKRLELKTVSLDYNYSGGTLRATKIDILSPGKVWLRGHVTIGHKGQLSGLVDLGMKPKDLTWLPNAEEKVFTKKSDGFVWAPVKVSGTMKKPKQNLTEQIKKQILSNPLALIEIGGRLIGVWFDQTFENKGNEAKRKRGN